MNTDGFAIFLYDQNAWFVRREPNAGDPLLCAAIDDARFPYTPWRARMGVDYFSLEIRILAATDIRAAHQRIFNNEGNGGWIARPWKLPSAQIFTNPIWSTWAEYKKDINQSRVLEYAQEIKRNGFPVAQIEIDDLWERKYGDFTFDPAKFPDPKALVDQLHTMGYRVSLWMYPFVNKDSQAFQDHSDQFVRNSQGAIEEVGWWDGAQAAMVDFSNDSARDWFVGRVRSVQTQFGFDSFKFDAGESTNYGRDFRFASELIQQYPNLITQRYVEACAELGDAVEVRVAYRNQGLPIWFRMGDKDSNWGPANGLQSLIPAALTMALAGYSFILPDMIGGNAYNGEHPSEELYIRWVQVNAFLPSLQFSIAPWRISERATNVSLRYTKLHADHAPLFLDLARRNVETGEPIIRPVWWAAPDDPKTYTISDQFLVGDDILVAPVVVEKAVERQVYLPAGVWTDWQGKEWTGGQTVTVSAPLDELPWFTRKH